MADDKDEDIDDIDVFDDALDDDDALDEDEDEDEDEDDTPRAKKVADDEDEDEEVDPDDVEADLGEILKGRIAASDDDDDEEEDDDPNPPASASAERAEPVQPKRAGEWTCQGCFLIVSASQFISRTDPICPSGEDPCPSIALL